MQLKTKRLILRKPKKTDWKDIAEGLGEYGISKMTAAPYPYRKKDADLFIAKAINRWGKKGYTFFIELKSEKKIIGVIELSIDLRNNMATTASWINKKYWKKGYITEAKIAANDFAFYKLKLRRLNSIVFTGNKASNATQIKVGYKFEGLRRKYIRNEASGKIHDVHMYGLLKEDWKKARAKLLTQI